MATFDRIQLDPNEPITAEVINRLQTAIERAVTALSQSARRVTVTFAVALTDVRVNHGLGRPLVGYRIVREFAGTPGFAVIDGSPSTDPATYFNLRGSNTGTAVLEVF